MLLPLPAAVPYNCTPTGKPCCLPRFPFPWVLPRNCPRLCAPWDYYTPSALYGCAGELWKSSGRLSDYSYAGYMAGEAPIPTGSLKVLANLKEDYGAVGDGVADDTAAFRRALVGGRALRGGVLYLPPGTYV